MVPGWGWSAIVVKGEVVSDFWEVVWLWDGRAFRVAV